MKKSLIYILFLIPLFNGCQSDTIKNEADVFKFPVVIDSFFNKHPTISYPDHSPLFFGQIGDSVYVNYNLVPIYLPSPAPSEKDTAPRIDNWPNNYYVECCYKGNLKDPVADSSLKVDIKIDTSQYIHIPEIHHRYLTGVVAHPIMVINHTKDTLVVGYNGDVSLITEALNPENKWQAIEKRPYSTNSFFNGFIMILPPKKFVLTYQRLYSGNYTTKLRLKMGNNYSEVFTGRVHLSQLQ